MFKLNSHTAATVTNAGIVAITIFGIIYTRSLWSLTALIFLDSSKTDEGELKNNL